MTEPAPYNPDAPFASSTHDADVQAVVSRLFVYPVKSCAGVEVQEAVLTETGLEFDRAWMVVDGDGNFLTQRELPRMALIRPQLKHFDMILRAPGMLALHISLNEVEEPATVRLWGEEVKAYDMGAVAAQWFSDFLGVKARLVRFDPEQKRLSSLQWTGEVEAQNQFSDGYPVLLISEESLSGLNAKLEAELLGSVDMLRFRPNLVIGSSPAADMLAPHDEDRLEQIEIGTPQGLVVFKPVKPCPRCPIPNVDPQTAEVTTTVSDMLQRYRQDPRLKGAISFGMNLVMLQGNDCLIKVGQPVQGQYKFD